MSLPHFLNAAPKYIKAIEGMHPEAEKHETQIDVEPVSYTGFSLQCLIYIGVVVQWLDYLAVTQEPGVRFPTAEKVASHVAPP